MLRWFLIILFVAMGLGTCKEAFELKSNNTKLDKYGENAMVVQVDNVSVNKSRRTSSTYADIHYRTNAGATLVAPHIEVSNKIIEMLNNRQTVIVQFLPTKPETIRFLDDKPSAAWPFFLSLFMLGLAAVFFLKWEEKE